MGGKAPFPDYSVEDDEHGKPLTREERIAIRAMLEREERITWAYTVIKALLLWVGGTLAALVTFKDYLKQLFGVHQ